MLVFRICQVAHVAFDGEGARLFGGRWNSPGRPVVYASSSRALAALEFLVHFDARNAPNDLVLMTISVPDPVDRVLGDKLARGWEREIESASCVGRGDAWLAEAASVAMLVPSAVMPEEENVLVNPRHSAIGSVSVTAQRAFGFDSRLVE